MNTSEPSNHPNNARLRSLLEASGLTQSEALAAFNRGQVRPISVSGFKAWLSVPGAVRWRPLGNAYLAHAEKSWEKSADTGP